MVSTQFSASIKILRSDNGREYINSSFDHYLTTHGIIHQTSCAHSPSQNGVAERKNRHLLDVTRCLLLTMHLPKFYWGDAVLTAAYLINRLPSPVLGNQTPLTTLGVSLTSSLPPRIFGSTCFVHIPSPGRSKLDPRALKCVFIGYSPTQKGYKCYHPPTRRTLVSADVTFRDSTPYYATSLQGEPAVEVSSPTFSLPIPPSSENIIPVISPVDHPTVSPVAPPVISSPPPTRPLQVYTRRRKGQNTTTNPMLPDPMPTLSEDLSLHEGIRLSTQHPISQYVSYDTLTPSYKGFVSSLASVSIPSTWQEALEHPDWKRAMVEEMAALEKNNTWDLTTLPHGKKTVGCKWVFAVKQNSKGIVERFKARLVVSGYTQTLGIDYQETFAPMAKMNSIRVLLSCAACKGWNLIQLDVKNVFLHGNLEEVYMSLPPGFISQGSDGKVCKLKKALYGLKQSPRAWFGRFHSAMVSLGYKQSHADHTLFIKKRANMVTILIVYVDDIIITGDDIDEVKALKKHLAQEFEVKDLGKLKYFLGIEVARSKNGILISQRKYILDLLEQTGLSGCRPADTPMEVNHNLGRNDGDLIEDVKGYQRLVGRLIYLSHTRADIAYAVGVVSQYMHSPRARHLDAAHRILRYLKTSPGRGILFTSNSDLKIEVYTDADWAGSVEDRRSTSGYFSFIGGNLVTWRSKKQQVISRSSAEAEFRAMAHDICEGLWLRSLMSDLGLSETAPIRLYCDNKAAISIANNPVHHDRTKHIEVDRHFIKEHIEKKIICILFVLSEGQLADILTKSLGANLHYGLIDKKETALDLAKFVDKGVQVKLTGGRQGYDLHYSGSTQSMSWPLFQAIQSLLQLAHLPFRSTRRKTRRSSHVYLFLQIIMKEHILHIQLAEISSLTGNTRREDPYKIHLSDRGKGFLHEHLKVSDEHIKAKAQKNPETAPASDGEKLGSHRQTEPKKEKIGSVEEYLQKHPTDRQSGAV
ncbi:hypothetical protein KSP39_PZI019433 [Platanthera zijinensis]|uniref:Integrase catalytic domain-containing protein n=1 Tax=Platanthera zijinensis TaxID=2320716 RepID=A0AAP0B1Z8_9ASPA